jgi:hypothetical protein
MLGVAVAIMSITTTLDHEITVDKPVPVSQDVDQDSEDMVVIKVDQPATISNVTEINLTQEWHLILDVLLPEEEREKAVEVVDRFTSDLFRTLFQRIISPNAP